MKDGAISVHNYLWIKCFFRGLTDLIYLSSTAKGSKYVWHLAFTRLLFIISLRRSQLRYIKTASSKTFGQQKLQRLVLQALFNE